MTVNDILQRVWWDDVEHFIWKSSIITAIIYPVCSLVFLTAFSILDFDDEFYYIPFVLVFCGLYFVTPTAFSVFAILGILKKSAGMLLLNVFYSFFDGTAIGALCIAFGMFFVNAGKTEYILYGTATIVFGFVYWAYRFYLASMLNSLRLKYVTEKKLQEEPRVEKNREI